MGECDILLVPGSAWDAQATIAILDPNTNTSTPVALTDWAFSAQGRPVANEETDVDIDTPAAVTITVTPTTPQTGGNIGKLTLSISAADSQQLFETYGFHMLLAWDLLFVPVPDGPTYPMTQGYIRFYKRRSDLPE